MNTILLSAKEILQPTIHAHANLLIDRPAPAIFHYIATEFFENYPKWSPEVLELEPLTPGPVRLGGVVTR